MDAVLTLPPGAAVSETNRSKVGTERGQRIPMRCGLSLLLRLIAQCRDRHTNKNQSCFHEPRIERQRNEPTRFQTGLLKLISRNLFCTLLLHQRNEPDS